MRRTKVPDKKRITIDLSQEFFGRLDDLVRRVGAGSKAEVIRDALQLYEYIADRQIDGYSFQAKDRAGAVETLVFLDLPTRASNPGLTRAAAR